MRLAVLAVVLFAAPAAAQSADPDRTAVLAVVDSVFQAMATRDTALLSRQFDPGARLIGVRQRDTAQVMQALTVEQFGRFFVTDKRATWNERAPEPEVKIEGTLATVWARYDFRFGDQFSHCGVDALQLLKVGRWRIVSLADTYQRTGCPEAR